MPDASQTDPHTAAVRLLELRKKADDALHAYKLDRTTKGYELAAEAERQARDYANANAPAICEALLRMEGALREVLGDVERIRSACRFESDPDDFTRTEKYAHACATTAKNRIDAALSSRTPQADGET